ncbi:MAG TPA: UDP-N-acetylmuramoyl-L-alanine--D-glutamate ligase [Kofleriaceae bacterium]|jgi:UDP-N-acetylmuramoylalanine--D-glutamate ligase|nr:UDP-N-acetylmuramoyl-L-alanine--D-glutamate ligase [Kofleriaceae bacterium]
MTAFTPPSLRGKTVVVVGLAQTGIAVARFCARRGARVVVTDGKPADQLAGPIGQLAGVPVTWQLGGHDAASFTAADLVVMSPGVPTLPEMVAARAAGVEVIAEIELAYRFLDPAATLIAITGTNGKSTTTALTGALCEASGAPTFCGGNLGNMPLIDAVDHPANAPGGLIVAEVAAFMLENCRAFRARAGVLTNITEDHLDRFGTMERYAEMKGRIWDFQRPDDLAIANAADRWTMAETAGIPSRLVTFDSRPGATTDRGAVLSPDRGEIVLRGATAEWRDREERYPTSDLVIVGNHNLENAMGAYLAARGVGVPADAVRAGAQAYRPLPHRMELVGEAAGIQYYDDSKGTNVASVAASVRGFPRPLVLIAGGVDKGGSYQPMLAALDGVCKGIVLIGQAAPLIRAAAAAHGAGYPVIDASDMHDAVRRATELCGPGDAVVLSPACSSYDMFQNFGHRGRVFRDAVARVTAPRPPPVAAPGRPATGGAS